MGTSVCGCVADENPPAVPQAAFQAERDPAFRTWLHGSWLLRDGCTLGEVAEAVGVHYRTVQRWVARYRAGGVTAVRAHRMGGMGQPSFLAPAQAAEVFAAGVTMATPFGFADELLVGLRGTTWWVWGRLGVDERC